MAHLIPDSIHGTITLSDEHAAFLDSLPLARLRNVKQLGFTSVVYTGATHTRYEHSLGTYHVISELVTMIDGFCDNSAKLHKVAALLSEIGIYPFSYCSRPIFLIHGLSKGEYQKLLLNTYYFPANEYVQGIMPIVNHDRTVLPQEYLTLIGEDVGKPFISLLKLASTIDYVLRDSFFVGRFVGGFDYRAFKESLMRRESTSSSEMQEMLCVLHRSVHHLNRAYGDYTRRALTALLYHLHESLLRQGALEPCQYKTAESIVQLDDDAFSGRLGDAVNSLAPPKRQEMKKLLAAVLQLRPIRFHVIEDENLASINESQDTYLTSLGYKPNESIVVDTKPGLFIGYRAYGHEYETYAEAISDPTMVALTGLSTGADFADMPLGRPFAVCWG